METKTLFKQHWRAPETRTGRFIGGNMSRFLDDTQFFWAD
jgi:hypothetical protein